MRMSRMGRKSRVTIPAELRRREGIEPGDKILVNEEDGRIIISKSDPHAWLARMEAYRADRWNKAAEELKLDRLGWDRCH